MIISALLWQFCYHFDYKTQNIDGSCFNEEKENIKQPYQRYPAKY